MNPRPTLALRRTMPAVVATAAILALTACGGGGSDAAASNDTPTTTTAADSATPPADASRPAGGGFGTSMQAFTQCLSDQGLDVQEIQPGGQGGPPADGSMPQPPADRSRPDFGADGSLPAPPADGSMPQPPADGRRPQDGGAPNIDPNQMAQFLAQRLGLDTSDATVAAAIDTCTAQLGTDATG